jgi:DNA (cytosine-5)-methyltransferase 1
MTNRDETKPPYRIPPMSGLKITNQYKVASTFSGAGGSCTGYRMAGMSVAWANEMEPNAAENYKLNNPASVLDTRDIRIVKPGEILSALKLGLGELDLLDGSPPCQSFSTAGKREKNWGKRTAHGDGTMQRCDDLFFEYTRVLKGIQPKVFVAENVSGLVKGVAKGYFKQILAALKACGYVVEARLLDAQWLGVPQMRQRIIFIGVRVDLAEKFGVRPEFPEPLKYRYSVRDALEYVEGIEGHNFGDVDRSGREPSMTIASDSGQQRLLARVRFTEDTGGKFSYGDFTRGPSPTVRAAGREQLKVETDLGDSAIGREWDKLKLGQASDRYFNPVKPKERSPCPTVTSIGGASPGVASVTHPTERRKFTIAELRRICGFPDDFQLVGSYAKQWARLGNSVPPPMAATIAKVIIEKILNKVSGLQSPTDV